MFIVGIDIAKRNHEAVIISREGDVVEESFSFSNSCSGYNVLLEKVRQFTNRKTNICFGMESTSHYWLPLYTRLMNEGYLVHVINPLQSHALRGMYIRKTKTDAKDSFIIAEVIRFGRFTETEVPQDTSFALRELCRNRSFMSDTISDYKRKIRVLLDQVFPEYETIFSNVFILSSIALLQKYPTPAHLTKASTEAITNILFKASGGYYGKGKALVIKELAQNSFGVEDTVGVYSELIRSYMKQIKFLMEERDMLERRIKEIMLELDSPITTITGVGYILGAIILSEIGDISRFSSSDKLAAFAGVDPAVSQSGDFTGTKVRMSKRGSPYLRRALWMAATSAARSDPMFHAYLEKKQAQGKKYMVSMGHVTKKMACVVYAILRDNKEYVPHVKVA